MTWLEFKQGVYELITVDAERMGSEAFVNRQIALAVDDLQSHVEFYRIGHETTYEVDDLTDDGYASRGELPAGAYLRELYHVKVGNNCVSRPLYWWDYSNRRDLKCGAVGIGCRGTWFRYTVDPQMRSFWVYPRVTSGYQVKIVWDGKKTSFEDEDSVPFDEPVTLLVAEWVKMKMAREVDRDLQTARDYERSYFGLRRRIYLDIKERMAVRTTRSKADCAGVCCTSCGCENSTCGCNPVVDSLLTDTAGNCTSSCTVIETPETEWAMFGDSGEEDYISDTVAVATAVKAFNPEFIIHMGDTNYPSGAASGLQDNLLKHYYSYIQENFYAAFGNHDLETEYGEPLRLALPMVNEAIGDTQAYANQLWYSFSRGPVRFFVLNSGTGEGDTNIDVAAQEAWLSEQIAASESEWNVVVLHRPPYTSDETHSTGSALFRLGYASMGADIVISAHAHNYERIQVDGLTYLVCGLGGALKRDFIKAPVEGSQFRYNTKNGYLQCHATEDKLQISLVTVDGDVIDRVTLEQ